MKGANLLITNGYFSPIMYETKVNKILNGLNLNYNYDQHPSHRWINENGNKVYTSGLFLYLRRKSV